MRVEPIPPAAGIGLTCFWLSVGMLLALLAFPVVSHAAAPTFRATSANGERLFFDSDEQLVPGDTDTKRDLYVRSFDPNVGEGGAFVTRQVSTGPTGGNDAYNVLFERVSADGGRAYFSTEEPLVAADLDRETDVYVRDLTTGATELVSKGAASCQPGCGNGEYNSGFAGASADGAVVLIATLERLDPSADTDNAVDVYARFLGAGTELVSSPAAGCAAPCGNGAFAATARGISADGSRAFFVTPEPLSPVDGDTASDIYAHDLPGGPTTLVSAGDAACAPCGSNDLFAPIFAGVSSEGGKVFFSTAEGLVPEDDDGANDVYRRFSGATTLVSGGLSGEPAAFRAAPGDGSRVFFATAEGLIGGDVNAAEDVYLWQGGSPQLLTSGGGSGSTFGAVTSDGESLVFTTTQSLVGEDGDESADIYAKAVPGGEPLLVSVGDPLCGVCGNGSADARFNGMAADGERVFFTSEEPLVPQDVDGEDDIYARDLDAGVTTLTTPQGVCPVARCDATFVDSSSDAVHLVFQTIERLHGDDTDLETDIYERAFDPGLGKDVTRLVSTGNSAGLELGPGAPQLTGTSPGSPGSSAEPRLLGNAEAGALIKVYVKPDCSGEAVATGTAAQLGSPGIAVKVPAGQSKTFWATAEAEGFASLCSNSVSYTQQDPASPPPAGGGGETGGGGSTSGGGGGSGKSGGGSNLQRPLTRITFGPAAKTRLPRPIFRFTDATGQPGTRFQCKVDRGSWKPCGSPLKLQRLSPGRHVFRVKGVNAVGVAGDRAASRAFKVVSG